MSAWPDVSQADQLIVSWYGLCRSLQLSGQMAWQIIYSSSAVQQQGPERDIRLLYAASLLNAELHSRS